MKLSSLAVPVLISAICHLLVFLIVVPRILPYHKPRRIVDSTVSFLGSILEEDILAFADLSRRDLSRRGEGSRQFIRTFHGAMPTYRPAPTEVEFLRGRKENPQVKD